MKIITQEEYERFYDDIMEYLFWKLDDGPYQKQYCYCVKPGYFEEVEQSRKYNLLHQNEISLSEREYGRFIDEHFKSAIIYEMCNVLFQNDAEKLKWEIALAIQNNFINTSTNEKQRKYDKFYNEILRYVYNGLPSGKRQISRSLMNHIEREYEVRREGVLFCLYPSPDYEKVHNITSQISLSERKYGCFIDNYFKEAYARYLIKGDFSGIEEMKSDIAFIIQELFEDGHQISKDSLEMEMIREYFDIK